MNRAKPKYTRANKKQRDDARRLVAKWYHDRCEAQEERFRAVRSRPVLLQSKRTNEDRGPSQQPWDQPLTADGKETRSPPKKPGLKDPLEVNARGGFELDPLKRFAERVMQRVRDMEPASHAALEMDAAGYNVEAIADELGCGERLAKELLSEGLASVRTLILVRGELGW